MHSFGINEPQRTKNSDKVFFTTVEGYASTYARRACKRIGGVPVIYKVVVKNEIMISKADGLDVYCADEAIVVDKHIYTK